MSGQLRLWTVLPGIVLLAGCDAGHGVPPPEPRQPVVVDRPVEPRPPPGPTGSLKPWEVSRGHVGPLTAATPYSVEAIGERMPSLKVEQSMVIRGDVGMGVITVSEGQKRMLEIEGKDWITAIRVIDRRFSTRSGRRIGQTWREAAFTKAACRVYPTWFDESTALECRDDRDPGLRFYLSIPKVALSRLGKGDVVQYDKAVVRTIDWSH